METTLGRANVAKVLIHICLIIIHHSYQLTLGMLENSSIPRVGGGVGNFLLLKGH